MHSPVCDCDSQVCERIIVSQLKMFNASNPHNYETYVRPWIFGWKGNPDFESGVIFEGASDKPTFLRGETGAQSTIIPSLDVILGVTHKADMLRVMLQVRQRGKRFAVLLLSRHRRTSGLRAVCPLPFAD